MSSQFISALQSCNQVSNNVCSAYVYRIFGTAQESSFSFVSVKRIFHYQFTIVIVKFHTYSHLIRKDVFTNSYFKIFYFRFNRFWFYFIWFFFNIRSFWYFKFWEYIFNINKYSLFRKYKFNNRFNKWIFICFNRIIF